MLNYIYYVCPAHSSCLASEPSVYPQHGEVGQNESQESKYTVIHNQHERCDLGGVVPDIQMESVYHQDIVNGITKCISII